jgi:hypothetical protein
MSNRLKEFFTAWIVGLIVGAATLTFRHNDVGPVLHILACGGAVGAFAINLLAPNTLVMLAALIALPIAQNFDLRMNFLSYWVFQLSASYLGWVIFELVRHRYRLASDQEYRDRYEQHIGRRG